MNPRFLYLLNVKNLPRNFSVVVGDVWHPLKDLGPSLNFTVDPGNHSTADVHAQASGSPHWSYHAYSKNGKDCTPTVPWQFAFQKPSKRTRSLEHWLGVSVGPSVNVVRCLGLWIAFAIFFYWKKLLLSKTMSSWEARFFSNISFLGRIPANMLST